MLETTTVLHDRMVEAITQKYQGLGYTSIKADHISYVNGAPEKVGGYIPDVTAIYDYRNPIICESKATIEDFDEDQLRAFFNTAAELQMIVPKSLISEAEQKVNEWGIVVNQWWSYGD